MVEVVVATSIILVSVLAAMSVAQKSIYVSRESLHMTQSAYLLEEGAEVVRILRDNAWINISSLTVGTNYYPTFSGGTWILSTGANTIGIFTRKVTIASVNRNGNQDISTTGTNDTGTKLITITVSWLEGGNIINKILQFYITDIFS